MKSEHKKAILNSVEAFLDHIDKVQEKVTGFVDDLGESIIITKEEDGFTVKFNTKAFDHAKKED